MSESENILENNSCFKTPAKYFQTVELEIEHKIIEDAIKERCGNTLPFKIPDRYFDSINPEIFIYRKKPAIKFLKPYISIAAGILLLAGIWQIIINQIDSFDIKALRNNPVQQGYSINNNVTLSDIDLEGLNEEAEIFLYDMDQPTILSISEQATNQTQTNDDLVYDFFIDYDSGVEYIDYITEQ
jgi:hypothetical protein